MKTIVPLLAVAMMACVISRHSSADSAPAAPPTTAPAGIEIRGTRRIARLPELKVDLPNAPGKELVTVSCGACHTPNYIVLQPRFPRETWIAEVTKMRKSYMAPIPDEKVDEIVNYLVAVRGK